MAKHNVKPSQFTDTVFETIRSMGEEVTATRIAFMIAAVDNIARSRGITPKFPLWAGCGWRN